MDSVSFAPLISEKSKVIILGTMPGIKSLNDQQYYAHKQNAFWYIMSRIFNQEFTEDYEKRKELIINNKLALWDTLKYCFRQGSLDSNIKNALPNNITDLLFQNRQIKHVIFNGQTAQKFYDKFHDRIEGINYRSLPSTSPANAKMKIEYKFNEWAIIKEMI